MLHRPAPIALFAYNRPYHTQKALESLTRNKLFAETELYVYLDGPRQDADGEQLKAIESTRKIAHEIRGCKALHILEAPANKGLARSVIEGVTKVVHEHGRIIVVEDDLVVGEHFLEFMNEALVRYQDEPRVMQVSGFAFDAPIAKDQGCYFMRLATTWGWATWKRTWDKMDFELKDHRALLGNAELRSAFDLDDSYPYSEMLKKQMEDRAIDSWGIRFYYNLFVQKGLVLHPDHSLVMNTGFDNSGTHCNDTDIALSKEWDPHYAIRNFPPAAEENRANFAIIKKFLKDKTAGDPGLFHSLKKRILQFKHGKFTDK